MSACCQAFAHGRFCCRPEGHTGEHEAEALAADFVTRLRVRWPNPPRLSAVPDWTSMWDALDAQRVEDGREDG